MNKKTLIIAGVIIVLAALSLVFLHQNIFNNNEQSQEQAEKNTDSSSSNSPTAEDQTQTGGQQTEDTSEVEKIKEFVESSEYKDLTNLLINSRWVSGDKKQSLVFSENTINEYSTNYHNIRDFTIVSIETVAKETDSSVECKKIIMDIDGHNQEILLVPNYTGIVDDDQSDFLNSDYYLQSNLFSTIYYRYDKSGFEVKSLEGAASLLEGKEEMLKTALQKYCEENLPNVDTVIWTQQATISNVDNSRSYVFACNNAKNIYLLATYVENINDFVVTVYE